MDKQDNEPNIWGLKKLVYIEHGLIIIGIILILIGTGLIALPKFTPQTECEKIVEPTPVASIQTESKPYEITVLDSIYLSP